MDADISNDSFEILKSLYQEKRPLSQIPKDIANHLEQLNLVKISVSNCEDAGDLPPIPVYTVTITEFGRGYVDGRLRDDHHIKRINIRGWIAIALSAAGIVLSIIALLK